jgi:hypothetical protein
VRHHHLDLETAPIMVESATSKQNNPAIADEVVDQKSAFLCPWVHPRSSAVKKQQM